jgi:WD40 repeat protein/transcriptional regulator with XRE-family HTH domain
MTSAGGGKAATADPGRSVVEVSTRAELGELLTDLRRRSSYSLRDLAAEIGSSPSTLSGWCRAENLPFPSQHEVFRQMLRTLGVEDTEPWMDALLRVRDGTATRGARGAPPYPGLESFGPDDVDRFFGREALVHQAHDRWRSLVADEGRANLLALVGPSGAGKSSLLHAGLRPRLEAGGTRCAVMTPGPTPLDRLDQVVRVGRTGPTTQLSGDDPTGDAALVVVVDQLEELFTVCQDAAERLRFLDRLDELADPANPGGVVVALRIDFYAPLVATGRLVRPLQDAQVLVGPLARDELLQAIVGPAEQVGMTVDDDLVALLLRDFVPSGAIGAQHDAGALPLLSHALLETWQRARRGRMTVADYHAAGGIDGAIERSAEDVYAELTDEQRRLTRQLFLRLVHLQGDTLATRRDATYEELDGLTAGDEDVTRVGDARVVPADLSDVLERFVDARLLTAHRTTVRITHEALLAAWPRLRGWIEEDRDDLRLHRELTEAARTWHDNDRDPSMLARGLRLDTMRSWLGADSRPLALSRLERDFIDASIAQADAEALAARRRTSRLRTLVAVTSVLGVLAVVAAVLAVDARSDALHARDEALSRQVALTADRLADVDPTLAAQLAVVGYGISPTSEARSALLDAAANPTAIRVLGGAGSTTMSVSEDGALVAVGDPVASHVQLLTRQGGQVEPGAVLPLTDPDAESFALAFAPGRDLLLVGDTMAAITVWDVSDPVAPTRLGAPLHGPEGPIQGLAFHPEGHEVAAVGLGDGVFRWDLTDPTAPSALELLPSEHITWSVAYHPDGTHLVVGEDAGDAVLWELGTDPRRVASVSLTDRSILAVAFAPDGSTVVAGSRTGALGVWELTDLDSPSPVEVAEATFDSWLNTLAFDPEGTMLAAGSSDGALRLYDTTSWTPIHQLAHPAAITTTAFTSDGATLLSVATDGTTRFWDVASDLPVTLGASIWSLGFTADGTQLAAFSAVDTGVFDATDPWRLRPRFAPLAEPEGDLAFSGGGAVSPDGSLLAHGTRGGDVLVHRVTDGGPQEEMALGRTPGLVEMAAFSADGGLLAAGGGDTDVRVWELGAGGAARLAAVLDEPAESVLNVAFSPGGRLLAAASVDAHVHLYDLEDPDTPRSLARLGGLDSEAYAAAFSPDGRVLATGGTDAVVLLWDLSDPAEPQRIGAPIGGPPGRIFDLAFDATGTRLAAAVADGSTWVWDTSDLADPTRHAVLGPSPGPIYTVRFGPGGQHLVAGGAHAQLHRWPIDERTAIDRICARAGDPLTAAEWELHLPGRPYDPPCHERG